jgi:crotonobetaine/carnitine-CoA ligase
MLTFPKFTPHFPREHWTLPQVLETQARVRGESNFLSFTDAEAPFSFAETNRVANRLAHGLLQQGIKKGDHVCILLPNCAEFVFFWFALQKIGAVEVPLNDLYKGAFLEHPINISQARLIVTTAELAQRLADIEDGIPGIERCLVMESKAPNAGTPPSFHRIKVGSFEEICTDNDTNPGIAVSPSDTAAVLFTSGTTGPSKGVIMPHSQLYFFAEEDVQLTALEPDDVYMTGFPLFHGNAQFLTVYPCLIAGAHCVLYPRFSASDFIARARRSRATVTNLLGATMAFICAQPPQEDDRDHRLRCVYAAPLSPELGARFVARFGTVNFVDGFGQTEISIPFMTPPDAARPPGASGVLVSQWFEARLVDPETGEDVREGQAGELLVRNRAPGILSNGYLGMAEKTVEAWRDLWFHTGDAMKRDAEGWYYFVDRVKDALRRRGENISSFEVESVVRSHPAVADCAVVAVRAEHEAGEDEVKACIVFREGATATFEELSAWCDQRMPAFMVPRYMEVFQHLPQTPTEKVRKKELREAGITPATWDRVGAGYVLDSEKRQGKSRR